MTEDRLNDTLSRRTFISTASVIASAAVISGLPMAVLADDKNPNKVGVEEVSPVEDLMREHGGLNRILLIYDETLRRFHAKEDFDPALLKRSAGLIHDFIEGYHEKLEEEHIFPRLKKAGRLVDTVDTLDAQHKAGRKLTETILSLSTASHFKSAQDKERLQSALAQFIRMYRPHEAREDTIVFPEFKRTLTPKEYDQLGDVFEDREHELFGKEGFDGIIVKIAEIEKSLGIYDLSKFTPKV
jgi:hemerythrin-like domain-containing protein